MGAIVKITTLSLIHYQFPIGTSVIMAGLSGSVVGYDGDNVRVLIAGGKQEISVGSSSLQANVAKPESTDIPQATGNSSLGIWIWRLIWPICLLLGVAFTAAVAFMLIGITRRSPADAKAVHADP